MEKKIFAFIGSRAAKKKTYSFVKEIITEISHQEQIQYEIVTLNDLHMKPCMGCESCFTQGACIQRDDLCLLEEKILESDLFIFAAPVYMHGMPGEVKNIIDRLATWAHTFRLAGKNVILVSTCDTNGHTSVVDDLHLKLLYMGARIIDKYVGANFIPEGLNTDTNLILLEEVDKELPKLVKRSVERWNSKMQSNRFHESLFQKYHELHSYLCSEGKINGETRYWKESGLLDCKNYQEYINLVLAKGKSCNG